MVGKPLIFLYYNSSPSHNYTRLECLDSYGFNKDTDFSNFIYFRRNESGDERRVLFFQVHKLQSDPVLSFQ